MSKRKDPLPDFPLTEVGDAEYFAHRFGTQVRFDRSRKQWLVFRSHHWEPAASVMSLASRQCEHDRQTP